jgi:hypothetical protein
VSVNLVGCDSENRKRKAPSLRSLVANTASASCLPISPWNQGTSSRFTQKHATNLDRLDSSGPKRARKRRNWQLKYNKSAQDVHTFALESRPYVFFCHKVVALMRIANAEPSHNAQLVARELNGEGLDVTGG